MRLLEIGDRRWRDHLESRRDATIFHHPTWAQLLADCYGFRAMAVARIGAGGAVVAGLPVVEVSRPLGRRRWVSLPFTDRCAPLVGEQADFVSELLALARSEGIDSVELRDAVPEGPAVRTNSLFVHHELVAPLSQTAAWQLLSTNHRRNIRAAERAGVRITQGVSESDVETFYRLCVLTRRRLGVPIQPRRFFSLLRERVLARGMGFVLTAYHEGEAVASAIFGAWNGTLVYKYGARDDRWSRLGASHLLMWTALRSARENGYHTFDLGRSDVDQPELRRFKSGWGAHERPLRYSVLGGTASGSGSKRLETAMSAVIRNSSPWVCRAVGELFYRYAA